MTAGSSYQRFRAPLADGEILSVPPWKQVKPLLFTNRDLHAAIQNDIWGRSVQALAAEARQEALAAAFRYTKSYTDLPARHDVNCPLIFTGHQPELVHPGVWLKNFASARLAKETRGIAVNLIVDSDLCRNTSIDVPTGTVNEPFLATVAYDSQKAALPYEQRDIFDTAVWDSFGVRVSETLSPLVNRPVLSEVWTENAVRLRATDRLGLSMAQARHRLERLWGTQNYELPQSLVCQTSSFRFFAVFLFEEARRFRTAYNDSLAQYRSVHRLRNQAQPMPDLIESDGWSETPFWIWTRSEPRRRALYVKRQHGQLLLSDLADWRAALPAPSDGDPAAAIEHLETWEAEGTKLRTRALTTTLFVRLLLADLFIHGIGGSKYDQVTEEVCERFFGICLPSHVTLSGTLRLPITHPSVPPNYGRQLRQQLRDLKYHPENHLAGPAQRSKSKRQIEQWIAKKRSAVQTAKTPANAAERHQHITAANSALQETLAPMRVELEQALASTINQIRVNQLLESRDFPFCLFPQELLRHFLLDF